MMLIAPLSIYIFFCFFKCKIGGKRADVPLEGRSSSPSCQCVAVLETLDLKSHVRAFTLPTL